LDAGTESSGFLDVFGLGAAGRFGALGDFFWKLVNTLLKIRPGNFFQCGRGAFEFGRKKFPKSSCNRFRALGARRENVSRYDLDFP
jgi:hypothetical protein